VQLSCIKLNLMATRKQILQELQSNGCRMTPLRSSIIEALSSTHRPWSVQGIRQYLADSMLTPDKTTVYRQLEFLEKQNIVREIDFGEGMKRYELVQGDHHHHLLCTECNKIKCIEVEENFRSQEEAILKTTDFKVTRHMLEFFGICKKCQSKK